jgi:hypothetical protein
MQVVLHAGMRGGADLMGCVDPAAAVNRRN